MVEPGFAGPHGILEIAEKGEDVIDEQAQSREGIAAGDRPGEGFERAGVVGEMLFDEGDDLTSDGIRFRSGGWDQSCRSGFAEAFAVFGIEIPCSAGGLAVVHEDIMAFAHFAVEEFHAQGLAAPGVTAEILDGAEKVGVLEDFEGDAGLLAAELDIDADAILTGFDDDDFFRLVALDRTGEFCGDAAAVAGVVERGVIDVVPGFLQIGAEMAHGGEEQGDALFVGPDVGAFRPGLDHPQDVVPLAGCGEGRASGIELITEDDDEFFHGWGGRRRPQRRRVGAIRRDGRVSSGEMGGLMGGRRGSRLGA